jgi:chromosome transmission fidelity protein 4
MQSTILNLSSFTITCTCTFSLPGAPSLVWIGFSETGIPLAYCEDGKLWGMLNRCFYSWSPLLDTNTLKGPKNEFIWPISVTFDNVLLYIPCFSGEKFPDPSQRRRNTLEAKLEPCPSIKLTSTNRIQCFDASDSS